jgi:hypothetical protein
VGRLRRDDDAAAGTAGATTAGRPAGGERAAGGGDAGPGASRPAGAGGPRPGRGERTAGADRAGPGAGRAAGRGAAVGAATRRRAATRDRDRDGDGVLQYAQRIRGTEGRLDGLVNIEGSDLPGPVTSLLNEAFARAEGKPGDPDLHSGGGYGYAILTAQGPHAEGGAQSYLVNGRLVDDFAVVAWPTRPGETGKSTFIMNRSGAIYEREFGGQTFEAARRITAFDPDDDWSEVEDQD